MADYKIALKLYQSQAGDENARVNISVNNITVGDNVEVSNTDSGNPTLFVYDAADLPDPPAMNPGEVGAAPGDDTTTTIKVELLNDFYVDDSNDRNVYWVGAGYACKHSDGNCYHFGTDSPELPDDPLTIITDWTDVNSFSWANGCEYQGDENGTVDVAEGWLPFAITSTYVSATIPLLLWSAHNVE